VKQRQNEIIGINLKGLCAPGEAQGWVRKDYTDTFEGASFIFVDYSSLTLPVFHKWEPIRTGRRKKIISPGIYTCSLNSGEIFAFIKDFVFLPP
jgi:hypothetical protein